ncbi:hypothetical protein GS924_25035 [Rhodococcus hoagii]|nr:hypothetical protein [Prescottella equi]
MGHGGAERIAPVRSALVQVCAVAQNELSIGLASDYLKKVAHVRGNLLELEANSAGDRALFGGIELGMDSDFAGIAARLDWVEQVRSEVGMRIPDAAASRFAFVTMPASELDESPNSGTVHAATSCGTSRRRARRNSKWI